MNFKKVILSLFLVLLLVTNVVLLTKTISADTNETTDEPVKKEEKGIAQSFWNLNLTHIIVWALITGVVKVFLMVLLLNTSSFGDIISVNSANLLSYLVATIFYSNQYINFWQTAIFVILLEAILYTAFYKVKFSKGLSTSIIMNLIIIIIGYLITYL